MEGVPNLKGGVPERRSRPEMDKSQEKYLRNEDDVISSKDKFIPPTPIDFIGLPRGSKESDFIAWTSRVLGVDPNIFKRNSPESKAEFIRINSALKKGREFLKNMLGYDARQIPEDPKEINSKEDLFDLLRETIPKFNNKEGLNYSSFAYCRLVRASIAAYETLKSEADKLKEETKDFENSMFSHDGVAPLSLITDDGKEKTFSLRNDGHVTGSISSRGKDPVKATLRFIVRPESDAATALKDGIASRIKVESFADAEKVLVDFYKWLILIRKVSVLKIENQQFFPQQYWNQSQKVLMKLNAEIKKNSRKSYRVNATRNTDRPAIDVSTIRFTQGKPNSSSRGRFEALKIEGTMPLLNSKGESYDRQFEIQIVLADNKNEKGKMDHAVYDVSRKVIARTRLDGGCPERVFNAFIAQASKDSGIPVSEIRDYLLGPGDDPIVKINKKNNERGERGFISYSVYKRWDSFGWVDETFMKKLEQKLEHAKSKK